MDSRFGAIPLDEEPKENRFGAIPLDEELEQNRFGAIPLDNEPKELEAPVDPASSEDSGPTVGETAKGFGLDLLQATQEIGVGLGELADIFVPKPLEKYTTDHITNFFQRGSDSLEYFKPEAYKKAASETFLERNEEGDITGLQAPSLQAVGSLLVKTLPQLPFMLSGATAVEKGLIGVKLLKQFPKLRQAFSFGATNSAMVAPRQWKDTYDESIAMGMSEQDAMDNADMAGYLTAALSFATGTAGAGMALKQGAQSGSMGAALARGFAAEAPLEGVEEGVQNIIGDASVDRPIDYLEALDAAALGMVGGGLPGSAISGIEYFKTPKKPEGIEIDEQKARENTEANYRKYKEALAEAVDMAAAGNQEIADELEVYNNSVDGIDNKLKNLLAKELDEQAANGEVFYEDNAVKQFVEDAKILAEHGVENYTEEKIKFEAGKIQPELVKAIENIATNEEEFDHISGLSEIMTDPNRTMEEKEEADWELSETYGDEMDYGEGNTAMDHLYDIIEKLEYVRGTDYAASENMIEASKLVEKFMNVNQKHAQDIAHSVMHQHIQHINSSIRILQNHHATNESEKEMLARNLNVMSDPKSSDSEKASAKAEIETLTGGANQTIVDSVVNLLARVKSQKPIYPMFRTPTLTKRYKEMADDLEKRFEQVGLKKWGVKILNRLQLGLVDSKGREVWGVRAVEGGDPKANDHVALGADGLFIYDNSYHNALGVAFPMVQRLFIGLENIVEGQEAIKRKLAFQKLIARGMSETDALAKSKEVQLTEEEKRQAILHTIDHEMIHAAKELDLFTAKEWTILTEEARIRKRRNIFKDEPSDKDYVSYREWTDLNNGYDSYPSLVKDEESIAELFAKAELSGKALNLKERFLTFMGQIASAVKGKGFKTADSIMLDFASGRMSKRRGDKDEIRTLRALGNREGRWKQVSTILENDEPSLVSQFESVKRLIYEYAKQQNIDQADQTRIHDVLNYSQVGSYSVLDAIDTVMFDKDANGNFTDMDFTDEQIASIKEAAQKVKKEYEKQAEKRGLQIYQEGRYPEEFIEDYYEQTGGTPRKKADDRRKKSGEEKKPSILRALKRTRTRASATHGGGTFVTPEEYSRTERLIYQLQDKLIGLKNIEGLIAEGLGLESLDARQSAYHGEALSHGKIGEAARSFERNELQPLVNSMSELGVKAHELDEFLVLRHAVERNAHIRKVNDDIQDGGAGELNGNQLNDAYVIDQMENRFGMTWNYQTRSWEDMPSVPAHVRIRRDKMKSLSSRVDGIVQGTLNQANFGGLLTTPEVRNLSSYYKYYVPLKGFGKGAMQELDETASGGVSGSGGSMSIMGQQSIRAKGRSSEAYSPIATLAADRTRTIIRSIKNKYVTQRLLQLAEDNPNKDVWEVIGPNHPVYKRVWEKSYTYMGPDDPANNLEHNKTKRAKLKPGDNPAEWTKKVKTEFTDRVLNPQGEQLIGVKVEGAQYFIDIKDRRLREAILNLNSPEHGLKMLGNFNRFLSFVNTSLNPEFIISNFARDLETGLASIYNEQNMEAGILREVGQKKLIKKVIGKWGKNLFKSGSDFYQHLKRKNPVYNGDVAEFLLAGAKADWFHSEPPEQQAQTIQSMLDMANGTFKGGLKQRYKIAKDFVELGNSAVENAIRFSTFKVARDEFIRSGIDRMEAIERAAVMAKNMTINFNRKGAAGNMLNSVYLFFNAGVQGTAVILRGLNTRTKQKILGGVVLSGFFNAMAHDMMTGDDEEGLEDVEDYVRERNMIISTNFLPDFVKEKLGVDNIKIPLPYGYNAFYNLGVNLYLGAVKSFTEPEKALEPEKAIAEVVHGFITSFNPLGGLNGDSLAEVGLSTLAPTIADPFVAIGLNKNYFGKPVYKEQDKFSTPVPKSHHAFRNTNDFFKSIAETANEITGGNESESGWLDVSPDVMEYLVGFGLGGAGLFGSRAFLKPAWNIKEGKPPFNEANDIPFLRKVTHQYSDRPSYEDYYDHRDTVYQKSDQVEKLRGTGKKQADYIRENINHIKFKNVYKQSEKRMRVHSQRLKQVQAAMEHSPQHIDQLMEAEEKLYDAIDLEIKTINDLYDKMVKPYD